MKKFLAQLRHPISGQRTVAIAPPAKPDKILCINGIFGDTDEGWQVRAARWFDDNSSLDGSSFSYWTGMFLSGQNGHADALGQVIKELRGQGANKVHIIAHSNGCGLIRLALQRYRDDPDVWVDDVWLIAAADFPDCRPGTWRNGWNELLEDGSASRLIITVSRNDGVLGTALQWFSALIGRTLGKDGPKHCCFIPMACPFDAVPTQPIAAAYTVARDDNMAHGDWVEGTRLFEIVAAVDGKEQP